MHEKEVRFLSHESAVAHVTGKAVFIDDIPEPEGMLHGYVLTSPVAKGRIQYIDAEEAGNVPGVHAILTAADIPGSNQVGPVVHDEPCLAAGEVNCMGQAICLIAAETPDLARQAAKLIRFAVEEEPPVLDIPTAIARNSFFGPERFIRRGDPVLEIPACPFILEGELETGAQEHWYLETQASLVFPGENNEMLVYSSSQHPSETQAIVAEVLGIGRHLVTVEVKRMGGGFGGKETQANPVAAWAALLAKKTGRPVKIRLSRDEDQLNTGKRHPFLAKYRAGFDPQGHLLATDIQLFSNGGYATDLSWAIMERGLFHVDNAYYIPHLRVSGRVCRTNLPSNTAFRGFGGPQGMAVVEHIMDSIARRLGIDSAVIRYRNFYTSGEQAITHYGKVVENNRLQMIYENIMQSSDYNRRRIQTEEFNRENEFVKRGLALTPVKFGISFTTSFLNQAGALVNIYQDGTVNINHGGTEMGQGLHTKMLQVATGELGISAEFVRVEATNTSRIPNTSATAASSGSDLNGMAVKAAIDELKQRLARVAAKVFSESAGYEVQPDTVMFSEDVVYSASGDDLKISFKELARIAYISQTSLSATGFYRTPGIHWDKEKGRGNPFYYFAFGMSVTEVQVDLLTGYVKVLRSDIINDVGNSLNPEVDLGQVRGGFIQGLGWITTEDVKHDPRGRLLNSSPDTYKIPVMDDIPEIFNVKLLESIPNPGTIHGSKAVGEPPFMLALSVWMAIRDALASITTYQREIPLGIPATNEQILLCIERLKRMDP